MRLAAVEALGHPVPFVFSGRSLHYHRWQRKGDIMADAVSGGTTTERRPLGAQEQYCRACGQIISIFAVACPHCGAPTGNPVIIPGASPRSRLVALLLCFFVGVLGVHRFYVGKIGTGILMIVTVGGLGLWVLIDFIMIVVGSFTDKEGRKLLIWEG
jgi:hypothetical protein